jgi:putative PIN family toxin of toxin-antitoxin system
LLVIFDASTIVGAALKADGTPRRALLAARERHTLVLSGASFNEIDEVLRRPKFARVITEDRRTEILGLLTAAAIWTEPDVHVDDCRDAKDNKYLELAVAAGADVIVSSDEDLLVLHPWRAVRILRPRDFLGVA